MKERRGRSFRISNGSSTSSTSPALYVSHSADEVSRFADFLVLLDRGAITASGPIEEMLTRLDLPLARGDDAKAILEAEVVEHHAPHHLTELQFQGGSITIPRRELELGQTVRLRILPAM